MGKNRRICVHYSISDVNNASAFQLILNGACVVLCCLGLLQQYTTA